MLRGLAPSHIVILGAIVLVNALRFVSLEESPPGFYVDEAINAANIICVRTEGVDVKGVPTPLFAHAAPGGGFTTPPMIGLGVVWTSIFGDSIGSFRALSAFATLITIIAIGGIGALLAGREAALWAALLASLSPWAWIFSRISWDPPLMPMFLSLGLLVLVFAWRKVQRRPDVAGVDWGRMTWLAVSSILLALAAYAYAPGRVVLPVLMPLVVVLSSRLLGWRWRIGDLAAWVLPGLLAALPLVSFMRTPDGSMRAQLVGIMAPHTMQTAGWTVWDLPLVMLENLALHLDPRFLLLEGDRNLRHAVAGADVALLSHAEAVAMLVFVGVGLVLLSRWWRGRVVADDSARAVLAIASLYGFGLIFFLPAAITWEGLPHALRSISVWPFWTAAAGGVVAFVVTRVPIGLRPAGRALALAVVAVSTLSWMPSAITSDSSERSGAWFDLDVVRTAQAVQHEGRPWQDFESHADRLAPPYLEEGRIYYRIVNGEMSCSDAIDWNSR